MSFCFFSCSNAYTILSERIGKFVPHKISSYLVTLVVFTFGITIKGEWILILVHLWRQFGSPLDEASLSSAPGFSWNNVTLDHLSLNGWPTYWAICNSYGFIVYYLAGGFLQWHFYVQQRDQPESWKCQPNKWPSYELQRHCLLYGSFSLFVVNTASSLIACYIANGGRWSTIYYNLDQYSYAWYLLQWPVVFILSDYSTYWVHRLYHTPTLYRMFHKAHHRYVQPTAFSVTAIHPVEILSMYLVMSVPIITVPVHWTTITILGVYTYYNGIIDHSGIDFKAPWWQPWKPDSIFHDNHHQYFHVNFGFNCFFWDKLHRTYRRTDRIYKEDIFYGKGKPLVDATSEEIEKEVEERKSENIKAHRRINPLHHLNSKDS